jgi:hypothetical protein
MPAGKILPHRLQGRKGHNGIPHPVGSSDENSLHPGLFDSFVPLDFQLKSLHKFAVIT